MPDFSAFLNSINKTKVNLFELEENDPEQVEKDYKGLTYVINRVFSYFPDCIQHAQELNMRSKLDPKLQYDYYLNAIPKKSRFEKGIKLEKPENLDVVKEYYGYSSKKARKALEIVNESDIEYLKARLETGGLKKKK